MVEDRRERLLRFIEYAGAGLRQYVVKIGDQRLPTKVLNDETLEQLAQRIRSDFWFTRKLNRRNRAIARDMVSA